MSELLTLRVVANGQLSAERRRALLATPKNTMMILRSPPTPSLDRREPLSTEWRKE